MKTALTACLFTAATLAGNATAAVQMIDLDQFEHGAVLGGVDLGPGVAFANNFHNNKDLLVAFDTTERNTRDRDLEGPNGSNGGWGRGNVGSDTILGNVLIVQEYDWAFRGFTDDDNDVVNRPDDEGRRSGGTQPGAGEITLDFYAPVTGFGFTLIDVEKTGEFNNETGFFATFSGGGQTAKLAFADLIDSNSSFYDATIQFGNNSANRVQMLTAGQLGLASIETVSINFGGSGAVGELVYQPFGPGGGGGGIVPTPNAAVAALAALGGLGLFRRKRRS